jgi:hypothetical protein
MSQKELIRTINKQKSKDIARYRPPQSGAQTFHTIVFFVIPFFF